MAVLFSTLTASRPAAADDTAAPKADPAPVVAPAPQPAETAEDPLVVMETTKGTIRLHLYPKDAPKTVANFVKLAKKGFYNGLTFHRVVPDFVIQGGDPNGDGSGGPGYTIPDEKNKILTHTVGALAMAKTSEPNSAGSQFYIVIGRPQPHLDAAGYTVFGKVTEGQDVAERIQVGDKMTKVTIIDPSTNAVIIRKVTPDIPDSLRTQSFQKSGEAKFTIHKDGSFDVELTKGFGNDQIDKIAKSALSAWKWKPATAKGEPVESTQIVQINLDVQ